MAHHETAAARFRPNLLAITGHQFKSGRGTAPEKERELLSDSLHPIVSAQALELEQLPNPRSATPKQFGKKTGFPTDAPASA